MFIKREEGRRGGSWVQTALESCVITEDYPAPPRLENVMGQLRGLQPHSQLNFIDFIGVLFRVVRRAAYIICSAQLSKNTKIYDKTNSFLLPCHKS